MRPALFIQVGLVALLQAVLPVNLLAADVPPTRPPAALTVWDAAQITEQALLDAVFKEKRSWPAIASGETGVAFKGHPVIINGRVLAVFDKVKGNVDLHAITTGGVASRTRLRLLAPTGTPTVRLDRVSLVENTRTAATVEAIYQTAEGTEISARFRLKRGEVALQIEPGKTAGRLRVECPGRFVVLPDFFADDIVIDARRIPLTHIEVPSENFLLHLTGSGDSIAMCVFENRQQDVKVALTGSGDHRMVTGSEIGFEGKKIWVALLEETRLWHTRNIETADAGKTIPLDWKMPFPAQWRVDFTKSDDMSDSWEMLLQQKEGGDYLKPSWLGAGEDRIPPNRSRWNTVLGRYPYPVWSDPTGQGYLQPLTHKALHLQGPLVLYPINRVKDTPLDSFTVVDVMRNTLGVGPCEHILDLEGQRSEYKGRATCSVRDRLGEIYGANQQKEKRADVEKALDDGLIFVTHIRGRITRYIEFGQKMRSYLADQRKLHPELADFITEMDRITQQIDTRVAARADKIQTPAHVAQMNAGFRKTVLDYVGPDALDRCKDYTKALVVIGDNQDELSGECRWVVKALRQRAGILMALDPRVAPIAGEIRARTQEALRNPASHEGARH